MSDVYIEFTFVKGDEVCVEKQDFEGTSGVLGYVTDYADEWCEKRNSELECSDEEWECDVWNIESTDTDHLEEADAEDFDDLDEWGDYCDQVAAYGEAYCLRYADIGDFDMDDEYNGCWSNAEDFVQNLVEDCYDLDIPSFISIDWECTTRDVMMDYSAYDGNEGTHIFRS